MPVDHVVASAFDNDAKTQIVEIDEIPEDYMGMDIGPKTIDRFKEALQSAKTVVWNGPMGVFEMPRFEKGTLAVCQMIGQLEDATTIVGGGDSAAAVKQLGYQDEFTHISTGGGASLTYLEGQDLVAISAIQDRV